MATSQNGYPVGRSHCAIYTVPGTRVQLALRKGPVAEVLLHLASRFDDEVKEIDREKAAQARAAATAARSLDDLRAAFVALVDAVAPQEVAPGGQVGESQAAIR